MASSAPAQDRLSDAETDLRGDQCLSRLARKSNRSTTLPTDRRRLRLCQVARRARSLSGWARSRRHITATAGSEPKVRGVGLGNMHVQYGYPDPAGQAMHSWKNPQATVPICSSPITRTWALGSSRAPAATCSRSSCSASRSLTRETRQSRSPPSLVPTVYRGSEWNGAHAGPLRVASSDDQGLRRRRAAIHDLLFPVLWLRELPSCGA